MKTQLPLQHRCSFSTARLDIENVYPSLTITNSESNVGELLLPLLSPRVTKELPDDWQNIQSTEQAIAWWKNRLNESCVLQIKLKNNARLIGLIFLYETNWKNAKVDLHLGYLLEEASWSRGYASEMLEGLIAWANEDTQIATIIGGVTNDNHSSIRVL